MEETKRVRTFQPVNLIGTETLFIISMLRGLRNNEEMRKLMTNELHLDEESLTKEMSALLNKLEVMSFPAEEV